MGTEIEGKNTLNSKLALRVTLCVLFFIIVGLIVAIVIVNRNNTGTVTSDDQAEADMTVGEEWVKEYEVFETLFNDTATKAKQLIGEEDFDIEEVYRLYDVAINDYISKERFDYAWALAKGEMRLLSEADLKTEALQALMRVDYNKFPAPRQYESYMEIIKLAESIGDNEALEKYRGLADETRAAEESVQEATAKAAAEFEAKIENAEEEPEE